MVETLMKLAKSVPPFDRVSVGFPGVVRSGQVVTAPHFSTNRWRDFPLQRELSKRLGKPARLSNDTDIQGLSMITGHGLEVVLTLGASVGSAIFAGGSMTPHLDLAHHPIHKSETYNEYLGAAARKTVGTKRWNRRVHRMIAIVDRLLSYDTLYLSGGNAANVEVDKLPNNVKVKPNDMGITGGVHLWDDAVWLFADGIGRGEQ